MRKLKIFSVFFLLLSVGAFLAFQGYARMIQDNRPPVITCESDTLEVSVSATEEDLLQGVTAKDNRSGDVTDSLVVENLSAFTEAGTRIVTYAAVDDNRNVGRLERTVVYTDYSEPTIRLSGPLCFTNGEKINILKNLTAQSSLDGDLTENIKYSLQQTINTQTVGEYPVEFRVMDSGGNTVYLNTVISVSERSYSAIKISLTNYLVYIPVGGDFDMYSYYAGADKEGDLTIQSNVDTSQPGTYYVDYIVQGQTGNGKSRLIVVVV